MQIDTKITIWISRLVIAIIFIINVQCAIQFIISPSNYVSAYGISKSGIYGDVALMGLGIAFLMWNVTYPAVIYDPVQYMPIYIIIIVQQAVGLVGESTIYYILKAIVSKHDIVLDSINRFMLFDGVGLIFMILSFMILRYSLRCRCVQEDKGDAI